MVSRVICQNQGCTTEIIGAHWLTKYCSVCKPIVEHETKKRYNDAHQHRGERPRYVYFNCKKQDCDWIESQLTQYRESHYDGDDPKNCKQ
jgi:hypothetical protein